MGQRLELADGGTVLVDEGFLEPAAAEHLFAQLLAQTPWQQEVGRGRPFPRLTAWYADEGLVYRYSGVTHRGTGWTPTLLSLKQRIEAEAGADFNSMLLNLYRDGKDSIGFHADDEPELGVNPVIASLSLGEGARFRDEAQEDRRQANVCTRPWLSPGHGRHQPASLAARSAQDSPTRGPRINLTLRKILSSSAGTS